jgi:hypothetical protein
MLLVGDVSANLSPKILFYLLQVKSFQGKNKIGRMGKRHDVALAIAWLIKIKNPVSSSHTGERIYGVSRCKYTT